MLQWVVYLTGFLNYIFIGKKQTKKSNQNKTKEHSQKTSLV